MNLATFHDRCYLAPMPDACVHCEPDPLWRWCECGHGPAAHSLNDRDCRADGCTCVEYRYNEPDPEDT